MKILLYEKNIVNNNAKVVKMSSQNLKLLQQSLKLEVQPLFLSLGTHRKEPPQSFNQKFVHILDNNIRP